MNVQQDEKPTHWRQQHGPDDGPALIRVDQTVQDADGNTGYPYRVRDVVKHLHERGDINDAAEKAARKFEEAFGRAQLTGYQTPDLARVLGSGNAVHSVSQHIVHAKDEVWRALTHLGGIRAPVGQAAWHVIGCGDSLKAFGDRCQIAGKSVGRNTARVLVIGACCVLVSYYRT